MVDDKSKYTDWSNRTDIQAELKMDLIILLSENKYPPVTHDEVYKEVLEQAENFKKYSTSADDDNEQPAAIVYQMNEGTTLMAAEERTKYEKLPE